MNQRSAQVHTGTVRSRLYRPSVRMLDSLGGFFWGGSRRRPVTIAGLRRTAERAVGFDDWGLSADYERAGELLEKDLADFPSGFVGRLSLLDTLQRHHLNRLKLRRALSEAPDDMGFKRPPYIVTGLFRTGTTLLHNLLAALPDREFLPAYELMCPVPTPGREADARSTMRSATFLSPETEAIHPMRWDAPEECWLLMSPAMRSQAWTVVLDLPTYTPWLDNCDMSAPYRDYRAILEYVSTFRDRGLVMKDPSHTPNIRSLHRAIPEARIVFLHRDPAQSVSSYCSLSAVHHRTYYGSFDPETVGRKVLDRFAHYLEAAVQQRPDIPNERILDVGYGDLVGDPIATVRRIVEHFGDTWSDGADAAVRAKLADMPRNKHGKHHYSAAQWGLTAEGIRERFVEYLGEHEVPTEVC